MRNLLISGYYGFKNAGDEAILASLVPGLRATVSDAQIAVISNNPEMTRKDHAVIALPRLGVLSLVGALSKTDLLISGGGSLLQDVTSVRSLVYYLGVIALAKAFGKKVMLFAQGFGPVNTQRGRFLARVILDKVDMATFRDLRSLEDVRALGVTRPYMEVTADPVFLLDTFTRPEQRARAVKAAEEALLSAGIRRDESPLLGVALRPWKDASADFETEIENALRMLSQDGIKVVLLPFHAREDLRFCEQIAAGAGPGVHVLGQNLEAHAMMELVGRLDLLLGMRLHSLIFAVSRSIPCAALPYDPKVESFAKAVGLPIATTVTEPSATKTCASVRAILENRKQIAADLDTQKAGLLEAARRNFDLASKLLQFD